MIKEFISNVYGFFFASFILDAADDGGPDTENGPGVDPDVP